MADPTPTPPRATERLRFTPRSLVVAVGLLGVTLAALRLFASTTRVLGWVVAASTVAGLLYPIVARLSRWIPRALALVVVVLLVLGTVSLVAYQLIDELVRETHALQAAAPDVGHDLEQSKRFGELARKLKASERISRLADEVPNRLRGGDTAQALRSAATRGVAFLVTGVLSLFLLLHGPRLLHGAFAQIRDPVRRRRVHDVAWAAYRRAWIYVAGSIAMALLAGLLAFALARAFDVPGAAPLAVWVALWDVVPIVGAVIGAVPIVALAATLGNVRQGIAVAVIMLAYAVLEAFVLQHRLEARSLRVGPFVTIVAGLVGVEVYGAGGALFLEVFATLAVAVLSELSHPVVEPAADAGPQAAPSVLAPRGVPLGDPVVPPPPEREGVRPLPG